MAPKSSEGEITDGSSSDPEVMKTCTGVALSLLGKRKAETSSSDDSGESEKTSTGEAEDDGEGEEDDVEDELDEDDGENYGNKEDAETEPEWGYDSFDDRKDVSCDRRVDSDKEFETPYSYYKRKLIETKGFFETTDKFPRCLYSGVGWLGDLDKPAMFGLTTREVCEKLTNICLQRYNEEENKSVKLDHILRANFNPSSMTKFYITFAARESPGTPPVEYQAKAAWSVTDKIYPILCRPTTAPERAIEEII